jgi:ribosomal protein S18 acetylase RimI-like enzyme
MTVTIRDLRPTDGDALRALWTAVGFRLIGDDDAGLRRFTERNPGLSFVAVDDGSRIVASTLAAWDGRRGWLYHVATAPDHRRAGLAGELVRRAETALRALGCPRASVIVEMSNAPALEFWSAQGYEIRDTRQMGKSL